MPAIHWGGKAYEQQAGESVLDTLLRQGIGIPHSCRSGVCQSCLLKAKTGELPREAQAGLKPALIAQGCFLACVCRPTEELHLEEPGAGARSPVRIAKTSWLSPSVLRVELEAGQRQEIRAGQYITLFRADGLARSYSIASLPSDPHLELHVRMIPNGQMSQWLAHQARPGTEMSIQGPAGNCFYTSDAPEMPLLLAGTGTGLAPLIGILRDAIAQGHQAPVWLYHGVRDLGGLYLRQELEALAAKHDQVHYLPAPFDSEGPLPEMIARQHPQLKGWRGYVCGDPQIVGTLKKRFFLAGMASREILSDAFLPSAASPLS